MIKWSVITNPFILTSLKVPLSSDWIETWLSPEVTASLVVLSRGWLFSPTPEYLHLKRRDDLIVGSWLCQCSSFKDPSFTFRVIRSNYPVSQKSVSTFASPSLMALARGSLSLSPSLLLHKSWWLISTLASQFLGVLSSGDLFPLYLRHPFPWSHPYQYFNLSCHGTHRITLADHTACGQMQLTSQREREVWSTQALPESCKELQRIISVTPVFIHEITRHLRPHYYRWYCMSFISPI